MADKNVWKWNDDSLRWDSIGLLVPIGDIAQTKLWIIDSLYGFCAVGFQGLGYSLYRTCSNWSSWDSVVQCGNQSSFYAASPSKLWQTVSDSVFQSADSGKTWQLQYTNSSPLTCIYGKDTLSIWVGGEQGNILRTKNSGLSWARDSLPTNAPVVAVNFISDTCGWAVTSDSTLWGYGTAGTGVTGEAILPLKVNSPTVKVYPNPSAGRQTIEYTLSKNSDVSIKIYDIIGRPVRSIGQGKQTAGAYRMLWDGCDDKGGNVPSGIYICRLKGKEIDTSVKLLVVRDR
jgi:hypothetical protein